MTTYIIIDIFVRTAETDDRWKVSSYFIAVDAVNDCLQEHPSTAV